MAAATKPRKATAKAPAPETEPAALADLDADGPIEPVRIGKRGRTPNPMVDLFELDGRMYRIPSKPSPALILRFQRDLRKQGRDEAVANLLTTLLGQEALDALAESPEVQEEDVADVFGIVARVAFGGIKRLQEASDPS